MFIFAEPATTSGYNLVPDFLVPATTCKYSSNVGSERFVRQLFTLTVRIPLDEIKRLNMTERGLVPFWPSSDRQRVRPLSMYVIKIRFEDKIRLESLASLVTYLSSSIVRVLRGGPKACCRSKFSDFDWK